MQTFADAEKYKKDAIKALAVWEIYTDYISGTKLEHME